MASQVLVTGRVLHTKMSPEEVLQKIRHHFSHVELVGQDFSILLADCRVDCFRSNVTTLDFTIEIKPLTVSPKGGTQRVVAATEMLIRATDTVWSGFYATLRRRPWRRPVMDLCVIEDLLSKHTLLVREQNSPLRSPAAKISCLISVLFLCVMAALMYWQFQINQPGSNRLANLLAIIIPLATAAIGTPIPVFVQWLDWRKNLVWRYVRSST
jgi:hypothetical protein